MSGGQFQPSVASIAAFLASVASYVCWHGWARVTLAVSGVRVAGWARGAPGLVATMISNRRKVKLGTVLSLLGPVRLIACVLAALNLFALRVF